ncbi:hypothetical protein M413DRAFT_371081 [Hebeloma cylindrosporum]|uniref:Uncharacterized protein n=1 Tax=Hebeloma cylindrosporum TaxID=76867 RepID=A0A0C3C4W1_HEBCY|nr:hypothetical protein M413DRAFT_371081 [Hebeloma cylindrosporum h7]
MPSPFFLPCISAFYCSGFHCFRVFCVFLVLLPVAIIFPPPELLLYKHICWPISSYYLSYDDLALYFRLPFRCPSTSVRSANPIIQPNPNPPNRRPYPVYFYSITIYPSPLPHLFPYFLHLTLTCISISFTISILIPDIPFLTFYAFGGHH